MESRRIQQVGERSFSITLPKWWVEERKLKQQDFVFMEMAPSGDLTLSAKQSSREQKTKEIHATDVDSLPEFLVLCYVKGIWQIRILGQIDYQTISDIKKTVAVLEGYTITSENEKLIEVSFMFGDINITISTIIQRIVYLLKLSVDAVERGDATSLHSFHTSILRLHNLSKRILGACTHDAKQRDANEIADLDTIFFLRIITKRLTSIGTRIESILEHKMSADEFELTKQLVAFIEQMLLRHESPTSLKEKFRELRGRVKTQNGLLRMMDLTEDLLESHISIAYNKKHFS